MQRGELMRHRLVPVAILLLLAGCAAGQLPPPPVAGAVGDVEIMAAAGAWRGWPADLSRFVTPIHLSLANRGGAPVRVTHDDFVLVASGLRLPAVLPYEVRGVVHRPPPPTLPSAGFSLDAIDPPATRDWALRAPPVSAEADPAYVGQQFELPSPDVLDRALPEGVLQPGGVARGFVYFERLDAHPGPVDLVARLVDAKTGETIGRVLIPILRP